MTRLARERTDDVHRIVAEDGLRRGVVDCRRNKPKAGLLTIGQAHARLGISRKRCVALLRRWGIEQRDDSVKAVVGPDLYRRLESEVRSGQ